MHKTRLGLVAHSRSPGLFVVTTECCVHMLQRFRTPLHLAALQGDAASVTGLCTYRAKVDLKDEHALTPLHKAAAQGHDEAAEELLAHNANPNATDEVCWLMLLMIMYCATTVTGCRIAVMAAKMKLYRPSGLGCSCVVIDA